MANGIVEGKRYVMRNSEVTGIIVGRQVVGRDSHYWSDGTRTWNTSGLHGSSKSQWDIVNFEPFEGEPIIIEAYKRYVMRDGEVTDPLYWESQSWVDAGGVWKDGKHSWWKSGRCNTNIETPGDIIALYVEPVVLPAEPVNPPFVETIVATRLKEGVYGNVVIGNQFGSAAVAIGRNLNANTPVTHFTVAELDEIAKTLTDLATFLRNRPSAQRSQVKDMQQTGYMEKMPTFESEDY